ncbi:hypothetical protein CPB84DRAFT_1045385 [Gymnopilus junonius]|uniref:F-box domain-containing protein n=1 Tax=Gymnopilus junonius TaxID=109634 RepID=A0A9P5TEG3_GYMJU|nr:hypothetical protein CPB84DRAFT_1045385 [Gymnopilus junonius]
MRETISYSFPVAWVSLLTGHLPAELLFSIFDHLAYKDLINVAQLCRRLNLMALPIVLDRAGFPEPEKIYAVKLGRRAHYDELTLLALNFSLSTLGEFSCVLSDRRFWDDLESPASQISDFTRNIHRVVRLISRLSSIRSVTLAIASWGSPWLIRPDVAKLFTDAVLDMVKASIQKSCTAFKILHCHSDTNSRYTPYKFKLINGNQVKNLGRSLAKHIFPSVAGKYLQGDGLKSTHAECSSSTYFHSNEE